MLYVVAWKTTPYILIKRDAVLFSGWVCLLVFSVVMLTKEQSEYMMHTAKVIVKCGLMYFVGKMIALDRNKNFMSMLAWSNVVAAVLFLTLLRLALVSGAGEIMYGENAHRAGAVAGYSQFLGYSLLPQACAAIFLVLSGWLSQIPFMLVLFYGILLSGARGPLVCAFSAGLITLPMVIDWRSWKSWLLIIVLSVISWLVIANYLEILSWFLEVFKNVKLSTRTIEALIDGTFSKSSGRTSFFKAALQGMDEYLFTGTGIYQDRQYLFAHVRFETYSGYPVYRSLGCYSHSILFDLPLQFGVFAGGLILAYFIKTMLKAYRVCLSNPVNGGGGFFMYVVLVSEGLFPIVFSGTWVDHTSFYLLMGFIIVQLKHKTLSRGRNCETYSLEEN